MYVACSTLCYAKYKLDDALKTIRDLHFPKVDLAIHATGPHLRPVDVAADPVKTAQRLKASNLAFAAFHLDFGPAPMDEAKAQLRGICRLARLLAVPVVTVRPAAAGSDLAADVARLADWTKLAAADGVMLSVETTADGLTADPTVALDICQRVPGLGLTLDPTCYLCGPHVKADIDPLFPFVRHVRLRDSSAGVAGFQVRVGQGEVEYGRIVTMLDRLKYDRALCVDVRDIPDNPFPVEPEVRKLKYLLESLV
ncbi:MAG: sugar phosphate isomerase/epimerase family protein [Fimbriiglobus sp.]